MHRESSKHFDRFQAYEPEHVLSGHFLVSPVGWFPENIPQSLVALPFVSLSKEEDSEPINLGESALLFSTN